MTTHRANDEQFWRAVERVAAQVAVSARNEGPAAGRKSFGPASRPASSSNGPDAEPMPPADRRAGATRAGRANGQSSRRATAAGSEPAVGGTTANLDDDRWIGAALSLVEPVSGALIDAIHEGQLDVDAGAGEEKLARAVSAVVTSAVIDAIGDRPEDFAFDASAGAPDDDGAVTDDGASPLDAMARVVAASVSSIVAEVAKGGDSAVEPAEPAGDSTEGEKILPVIATLAAPVVWHAIDAWRKRRRRKGLGGTPDDDAGDAEGMPAAARIAGEVVQAVVAALGRGKIMRPPYLPGPYILPERGRNTNRRYYIAA